MRTQGIALRRGGAASLLLSGPTLAALVAAAILLPPVVSIAGFLCVSAVALREFSVPRWLYLAVPLQYGFVATASWPLAILCVPLLATLAVPLVAVLAQDTRDLAARSAQQCWAVLFAVYALSHAPAIAMLPWPALGRADVAGVRGCRRAARPRGCARGPRDGSTLARSRRGDCFPRAGAVPLPARGRLIAYCDVWITSRTMG